MFVKLLSVGILAASLASAQYGGGGGGGGRGGGRSGATGVPGMPPLPRIYQIGDMLALDKEQRKQVKTIFDDAQKEAAPIRQQLPIAQLAIAQAIQAGQSQDPIAKTVDAYAALDAQMAAIELRAFTKVAQILRDDQKPRMPGLYRMMRGLFNTKDWNDPSGK
jgi:hypothetical protein